MPIKVYATLRGGDEEGEPWLQIVRDNRFRIEKLRDALERVATTPDDDPAWFGRAPHIDERSEAIFVEVVEDEEENVFKFQAVEGATMTRLGLIRVFVMMGRLLNWRVYIEDF